MINALLRGLMLSAINQRIPNNTNIGANIPTAIPDGIPSPGEKLPELSGAVFISQIPMKIIDPPIMNKMILLP